MLKIHFPEVKAGQALISGIAIASIDQELKPTVFPASGWSWEKADKEVMEKTPKELLPEDKNARVSISYEAEMAVLKGKFQKKEHRKQIGVFFGKGKSNSIEWNISTGLAQVYALRFNSFGSIDRRATTQSNDKIGSGSFVSRYRRTSVCQIPI